MKIMGSDGQHHNVTSQGQGNLNTVLGAVGTAGAMGLFNNGCGKNGLFGGLFGGNNNGECYVNKTELALSQQVASLQAEKYTDMIARQETDRIFTESRRQDDKIAAVIKDTTGALIEIGNAVSGQAKEIACLQVEVARNREEAKNYTDTKVDYEAQLRKSADENVVAWTQAELNKKVDGVLKIDGDQVAYGRCRPVLETCPCGSAQDPYNVNLIISQAVQAALSAKK